MSQHLWDSLAGQLNWNVIETARSLLVWVLHFKHNVLSEERSSWDWRQVSSKLLTFYQQLSENTVRPA